MSQARPSYTVPRLDLQSSTRMLSGRRGMKDSSPLPTSSRNMHAATNAAVLHPLGGEEESASAEGEENQRAFIPTASVTQASIIPLLIDLPDVVQRTVKGCSRDLEPKEVRLLAKLTTEQRCAALGMECEGYSHDVILSYLVPPSRRSQPGTKRSAYQPARDHSKSPHFVSPTKTSDGGRGSTPLTNWRGTSPSLSSTPRSSVTTGTPRHRPISPHITNALHNQVADAVTFNRQTSDTTRAAEREKLKRRTHYDANKEASLTPRATAASRRGRSGSRNGSTTPYWARATTSGNVTPRRTADGGIRIPAPKTFGETAHRASYLTAEVQRSSYRTRNQQSTLETLGVKEHVGLSAMLLNPTRFSRHSSSFMPPPNLSYHRQQSAVVVKNQLEEPEPRAPDQDKKECHHQDDSLTSSITLDGDRSPDNLNRTQELQSTTDDEEGTAITTSGHHTKNINIRSRNSQASKKKTAVTPVVADSLVEVSAQRSSRWIEDFHHRLSNLRLSTESWSSMSKAQKVSLFQQWRLPELQKRVILSRYP